MLTVNPCLAEDTQTRSGELHKVKNADVGSVEIVVAVIGQDLSVRPVPKFSLQVRRDPAAEGEPPATMFSTGFDGKSALQLPLGHYRLQSVHPLEWNGSKYSWELPFDVVPGAITHLELSADNARVIGISAPRVSAEAELYKRVHDGVFLVEAGGGHGTGFLVDASGLIVTNYHVIAASRYIAVQIDKTRKVLAQELASSRDKDIAILRVNPSLVANIHPLSIATSLTDAVVEGERVIAIGNPLTQTSVVTTGIASKVESDAIISDVNINPGNSGGPLLNSLGEVVGITTFGLLAGGKGPGISGVVRIHLASPLLAEAKAKISNTQAPPPDLLPVPPETPFPAAALREMVTATPDTGAYHLEAGKFDVEIMTPPLIHSLAKRKDVQAADFQKKRRKAQPTGTYDATDDFFEWGRYAGQYDAVVIIQAVPEIRLTGGAMALAILSGLGGTQPGQLTYRFKTDFRVLKLLRDGKEVVPIFPGRVCEVVATATSQARLNDVNCYGAYTYRPEEFRTGSQFVLQVYSEDKPDEAKVVKIKPELVSRVRQDFAPYFASTAAPQPPE